MSRTGTGPTKERLNGVFKLAQLSQLKCVADLGFVGWHPRTSKNPTDPPKYRFKALSKATADDIRRFTISGSMPETVLDQATLELPITFRTNLQKHVVRHKFPYGQIAIAALHHAGSYFSNNPTDG